MAGGVHTINLSGVCPKFVFAGRSEEDMSENARSDAEGGLSRRDFVAGSVAAGFALAVQPISAQTIVTDAAGLTAGMVGIPTKDRAIPGYRAMPEKGSRLPIVIVVHEIFGVHEHIKDICRRLAKVGYFAVAPDLYVRQGDVTQIEAISEIFSKVVSKVPDSQVMSDLDAAAAWAGQQPACDAAKLAITGFCWGGRIVWLYAAHSKTLKAGVAWYGRLTGPRDELRPKHPLDIVEQLNCPVLGLYGGADSGIPNDTVARMREALKKAGRPGEIKLYPDTPHGFHADYRPTYRKDAAQDGWKRLLEWFKQHGVS
jgi:carboxymethylenebutenolidase